MTARKDVATGLHKPGRGGHWPSAVTSQVLSVVDRARSYVIFERDELLICFGWRGRGGMTSKVTEGCQQSVDQAMPGLASLPGNLWPLCCLEGADNVIRKPPLA
jgi:hypothetical protein